MSPVRQRRVERARIFLEYGLQVLGAVAERRVEGLHVAVERQTHLLGSCAERRCEGCGVVFENGLKLLCPRANRAFEAAGCGRERAFEIGEVFAGARDDLRECHLLRRKLFDQHRDFGAERPQRIGDAGRGIDEGVAFAAQLLDQVADALLVLLVGAFEFGDLVVNERLEFARAAEGARDGVVHEGDLAAHRLA